MVRCGDRRRLHDAAAGARPERDPEGSCRRREQSRDHCASDYRDREQKPGDQELLAAHVVPPFRRQHPQDLSARGEIGLRTSGVSLSSFKFKLVAYFVLLSLVPMAATYWGFSTVAGAGESRQVTLRQEAGLRAALAVYAARAGRAQEQAEA